MNIEYRKIFNKNYAVINDYNITDYKECYRSKMLKSNQLSGFLSYDTQNINGSVHFTYDISSKQSIYSFYENSDIDYKTVRHLIMSLKAAVDTLNNYLLEPDYIILDPKMIYMNIATKTIYFCYCPGEKNHFYESLNTFICYILSKIDHEDNNSIILAYSLQQQSSNTNYTFDDLIEILNKQVFNHQNNHIDQTETTPKKAKAAVNDTSFYENNRNPQPAPDHIESNSFSGMPEYILKKNLKNISHPLFRYIFIIPACLFFSALGIILYYGLVLQEISKELMVIASAISAFISFNLFSFLKQKQETKSDTISNLSNNEISSCDEKLPLPENLSDYNTEEREEIKTATNYYEDTVILGYRNSENIPRLVYTGTDFISENELSHFPFIIGKMTDNVNMVIDNPMISRIHAKIYLKENHYYIEDMNSSNGTYINNTLLQPHSLTEICTGDYITFSHLTYIFQ